MGGAYIAVAAATEVCHLSGAADMANNAMSAPPTKWG